MSRPCVAAHPAPVPDRCRVCWLAAHRPEYAAAWGEPAPAEVRPLADAARPPCRHLGEPLTGFERLARGLDHARDWRPCGRGHGSAGVVCGCHDYPRGCRGCPAYQRQEPGEECP